MIALLLSFVIASIAATLLYNATRRFVRNRLRYVDAVQRTLAPWAAGGAVFLAALLIVSLIPVLGIGTAITAGLAAGTGVAAGARDIKQGMTPVVFGP